MSHTQFTWNEHPLHTHISLYVYSTTKVVSSPISSRALGILVTNKDASLFSTNEHERDAWQKTTWRCAEGVEWARGGGITENTPASILIHVQILLLSRRDKKNWLNKHCTPEWFNNQQVSMRKEICACGQLEFWLCSFIFDIQHALGLMQTVWQQLPARSRVLFNLIQPRHQRRQAGVTAQWQGLQKSNEPPTPTPLPNVHILWGSFTFPCTIKGFGKFNYVINIKWFVAEK